MQYSCHPPRAHCLSWFSLLLSTPSLCHQPARSAAVHAKFVSSGGTVCCCPRQVCVSLLLLVPPTNTSRTTLTKLSTEGIQRNSLAYIMVGEPVQNFVRLNLLQKFFSQSSSFVHTFLHYTIGTKYYHSCPEGRGKFCRQDFSRQGCAATLLPTETVLWEGHLL